jgi:hypothetical protein
MGAAQVQCPAAVPVGEQSKVPNLDEAGRQGMEQEAADELSGLKSHRATTSNGMKIAAVFSIVESCRKLGLPIRKYLADVLPGLADRSIHELATLTPKAYAATMAKQHSPCASDPSTMGLPERLRCNEASYRLRSIRKRDSPSCKATLLRLRETCGSHTAHGN